MEGGNSGKDIQESKHILGKLYRDVDCKNLYKMCVEGDHNKSVKLNYSLNRHILQPDSKLKSSDNNNTEIVIPTWH